MSDDPLRSALQAGVNAAYTEGQGIWRLSIYPRSTLANIEAAVTHRDPGIVDLWQAVMEFYEAIRARQQASPVCCSICGTVFGDEKMPDALAVLSPETPVIHKHRLITGICRQCAQRPDLKTAVYATYRTSLFPNMRIIEIGAAGHG